MLRRWLLIGALCATSVGFASVPGARARQQTTRAWLQSFPVKAGDLATIGENAYFILKPGYQITLEGLEDGKTVRLVVTVLADTKRIAGIDTRVVEERETRADALAEVSRNYFAIEKGTRNVYYFGEDVDVYTDGKVTNHESAWLHGMHATFGLMMPGTATVGLRYYQEMAPGVAMDRAEILSATRQVTTPAGTFANCLETEETTPLERGAREVKIYAPGIGLIRDGPLALTAHGRRAGVSTGPSPASR
jgi:hypothetical protein